jgi:hypothetical protein
VVAAHVLIVLTAVRARACRPYGNEKGLLSLRVTDWKPYAAVACYNSLTTLACTRGCCGGNVLMHGISSDASLVPISLSITAIFYWFFIGFLLVGIHFDVLVSIDSIAYTEDSCGNVFLFFVA